MPEAKTGDWNYNIKSQKNFSKKYNLPVQDLSKFKLAKGIGKYELYVHQRPSEIILVLGFFISNDFIVLCEGKLRNIRTILKDTYQMYSIKTFLLSKRCQGLATELYLYCLNELDLTIISDSAQYDGARKIYKVLIDRHSIFGAIINDQMIVEKNIKIRNISDPSIWFFRGDYETYRNKEMLIALKNSKFSYHT